MQPKHNNMGTGKEMMTVTFICIREKIWMELNVKRTLPIEAPKNS